MFIFRLSGYSIAFIIILSLIFVFQSVFISIKFFPASVNSSLLFILAAKIYQLDIAKIFQPPDTLFYGFYDYLNH